MGPDDRGPALARGSQLVGRHPSCDLVTHRECGDVSRGHMYLEWHGESRLQITDQSSMGTYLDSTHIVQSEHLEMFKSDFEPGWGRRVRV